MIVPAKPIISQALHQGEIYFSEVLPMKKTLFKRAMICCLALLTMTAAMTACGSGKDSASSGKDAGNQTPFSSIAGTWLETELETITALSIEEDGTYSVIYSSGAVDKGTIKMENEEHPDGTSEEWFFFYDEYDEFWAGFPNNAEYAKNPPDELWSGQDGEMHFTRVKSIANPTADDYLGTWLSGRCSIDISENKGAYLVEIRWSGSASEYSEWNYSCTYDKDSASLICDGKGTLVNHVVNEDGQDKKTTVYKDGSGSFKLKNALLRWSDEKEKASGEMLFLRPQD